MMFEHTVDIKAVGWHESESFDTRGRFEYVIWHVVRA